MDAIIHRDVWHSLWQGNISWPYSKDLKRPPIEHKTGTGMGTRMLPKQDLYSSSIYDLPVMHHYSVLLMGTVWYFQGTPWWVILMPFVAYIHIYLVIVKPNLQNTPQPQRQTYTPTPNPNPIPIPTPHQIVTCYINNSLPVTIVSVFGHMLLSLGKSALHLWTIKVKKMN